MLWTIFWWNWCTPWNQVSVITGVGKCFLYPRMSSPRHPRQQLKKLWKGGVRGEVVLSSGYTYNSLPSIPPPILSYLVLTSTKKLSDASGKDFVASVLAFKCWYFTIPTITLNVRLTKQKNKLKYPANSTCSW